MTDKPNIQPTPQETRDHAIRTAAIDMAIRSNCGQGYDDEGRIIFYDDWIVKAANLFENYIKTGKVNSPVQAKPEQKEW